MAFSGEDYIAVFDSGLGGLSVLRHLRRLMPNERYLYYGDCANAPYGSRTTAQVRELTLAAAEHLLRNYPVKALVVACNTATAAAIGHLRSLYPELIVIGIEPALKLAADRHPGGTIGVMATQVTLREEKFHKLWERFAGGCTVHPIQAPGLVELVETGKESSEEADALLRKILSHYPFAAGSIGKILGSQTELLDGGDGTARETRRRLEEALLLADPLQEGGVTLQCSGNTEQFRSLAQKLLDR